MTREELIASAMNSSLPAAELLRRDGEVIAALEAERDLLKQEVFAVREQHGNALIERDRLRAELAEHKQKVKDVPDQLRRAFNLGQTYWQQADSESYSQNKKADVTRAAFNALVDAALKESDDATP